MWRFFGSHHPLPYSHTKRSGPGSLSASWIEVQKQYPIDFALYGHRHQYERTLPVYPNPYEPSNWGVIASPDPEKYINIKGATISIQSGSMWYGFTQAIPDLFHAPKKGIRYDDGAWQTFTPDDGLVSQPVRAIHVAPDGVVWIGTEGGVSRYVPGE